MYVGAQTGYFRTNLAFSMRILLPNCTQFSTTYETMSSTVLYYLRVSASVSSHKKKFVQTEERTEKDNKYSKKIVLVVLVVLFYLF